MILVKGNRVRFTLATGRVIVCPRSYGLIHDTDGATFDKCTAIIRRVWVTGMTAPLRGEALAYYGAKFDARLVQIPRIPKVFEEVGRVVKIEYDRPGRHEGSYYHPFVNDPAVQPILFASGSSYRLNMGHAGTCLWDDRGISYP
jgi:hypothetical protein